MRQLNELFEKKSLAIPMRRKSRQDDAQSSISLLMHRSFFRKSIMVIYRVHVSLLGIEPLIWRRVELSSQTTLKQFHRILQIVMGWEDHHLHEFRVGTTRYRIPAPDYDDPGDVISESTVLHSDALPLQA